MVREEPMKHRRVPTHCWYILDVLDALVCCWQSRMRPQIVIPPAIRCERASKQRPQAMPQVAQKRIKSQAKRGQSCCDQAACTTERASLAGCGRAAFATGLNDRRASPKKHLGAPKISSKNGRRFEAATWAQNLAHTPGCSFKIKRKSP